jgi:aspartyl-tRNA(Asn)/glutamyl-tRNA(Gln) amidotransferase subunit C
VTVDRKTVEHVARLARLDLAPEELDRVGAQLGAILDYIAQLAELDLAGVEPLAHAAETSNVFREDVPRPSLDRSEALKNAPERTDEFFVVPKVVE